MRKKNRSRGRFEMEFLWLMNEKWIHLVDIIKGNGILDEFQKLRLAVSQTEPKPLFFFFVNFNHSKNSPKALKLWSLVPLAETHLNSLKVTMDKGEKRSFDQMEQSSVDEYVYSTIEDHNLQKMAAKRPSFICRPRNHHIDADSKIAALKASPSIVSLVSFSGDVVLCECSGTIIETEENNNFVMTSLNLIRRATEEEIAENSLADNLKIVVRSSDKSSYLGEIYTYDFHYNLLVLKFKSKISLKSAKLKLFEDDIGQENSFQLHPHSLKVKDRDHVVVVGRYFYKPFDLMAASGCLSVDRYEPSEYDCRELQSSSCGITICGDGGPLINLAGEVIGIAFFEIATTSAFLPINIAYKWWTHYKRYKEPRHPSYGFEATNLYAGDLLTLESVWEIFPNISNGLHVEKVLPGSYAESAGLREDDIIIKCDGKTVKSFLKLWDLMWDKVGENMELEVLRVDICTNICNAINISMVVGEATPNDLNNWPRCDFP